MTWIFATSFTAESKPLLPNALGLLSGRLLQDIDRARCKRVVDLEQFAAIGRGRHDQDRRRPMGHDVFGRGKPFITGIIMSMVMMSGRYCWQSSMARLPSSASPTSSMSGSAARRMRQSLAHRQGIIDDEDANFAHASRHQRFDHRQKIGLIELALDDVALRADVTAALAVFRLRTRRD